MNVQAGCGAFHMPVMLFQDVLQLAGVQVVI